MFFTGYLLLSEVSEHNVSERSHIPWNPEHVRTLNSGFMREQEPLRFIACA